MSYLEAAFGGFAPHQDRDAAAKFVLNVILMDNRLDELAKLATPKHALGAIEGEPSWRLERRDLDQKDATLPAYSDWPGYASYRAYVDPTGYELAYPECFMNRSTFRLLVAKALDAYVKTDEAKASTSSVQTLRSALANDS